MHARKHPLAAGFTLVEMAIVLLIVGLLLGGGLMVLGAQTEAQRFKETQRQLDEARDALLGFAVANGRLPCPALATSNGVESFCTNPGGACGAATTVMQTHGRCFNPYDGFLPGATLGLPGTTNGFVIDGWMHNPANRLRYAVYTTLGTASGTLGTVIHPFTCTDASTCTTPPSTDTNNGMQKATMATIAGRTPLLSVCNTATGIVAPGTANATCANPASTLTTRAAAVIYSLGSNAPRNGVSADELANLNGDAAFVSHVRVDPGGAGGEFDDLLTWLPITTLFNRMVAAQRLP